MRTIASLIYPDVMSLDVTGPLQVFASANVELRRQGQAEVYRLRVLGEQAGPVATSAGFQLVAEQAWRDCAAAELDTLLVPGGLGETAQCANQPLLAWLRAAEPQVRRLGSVCSGGTDPGGRRSARRAPRDHPLGRRGGTAPACGHRGRWRPPAYLRPQRPRR